MRIQKKLNLKILRLIIQSSNFKLYFSGILPQRIAKLCPLTKKIMIVIDKNVPKRFEKILKKNLKNMI